MRLSRRRVCSSALTSSQYFSEHDARHRPSPSRRRAPARGSARASCSEQKPITRSTPARLYQLRSKMTTSPAGGKVRDVALHVHLRLLALGGRGQRDDAEHPGADPLGDRLDRPALARRCRDLRTRCTPWRPKPSPTPASRRARRAGGAARARTPCSSSSPSRPRSGSNIGGSDDRRGTRIGYWHEPSRSVSFRKSPIVTNSRPSRRKN